MVLMVMEMLVEVVVRLMVMVERLVVVELEGVKGQSHHVRIRLTEPTLLTL